MLSELLWGLTRSSEIEGWSDGKNVNVECMSCNMNQLPRSGLGNQPGLLQALRLSITSFAQRS
jgi:hypothetical protein